MVTGIQVQYIKARDTFFVNDKENNGRFAIIGFTVNVFGKKFKLYHCTLN